MAILDDKRARAMDLKKSMMMGIDECLIALKEAYSDLADDDFRRFPVDGHMNIVTIVMHCLQQHDDFNSNLQYRRGIRARHEYRFLEEEERFELWGVPAEQLPKPGDAFPAVRDVCAIHDEIHRAVIANMAAFAEEEFISSGIGPWPRLCDIFFRATYHTNAHIRQIWYLRGVMKTAAGWPVQHYA